MDTSGANPEGEGVQIPVDSIRRLEIKVTDDNNEVLFKIEGSTKVRKRMRTFCQHQGKDLATVRFLYDGERIKEEQTPDEVSTLV
jgi:small ubiquitin-related modifier